MPTQDSESEALRFAAQLINHNRYSECSTILDQLLEKNPNNPDTFVIRGFVKVLTNQNLEGYRDWVRAAELAPEKFPIEEFARYAEALIDACQWDDALRANTILRKRNPGAATYQRQCELILRKIGRFDLALAEEALALHSNPELARLSNQKESRMGFLYRHTMLKRALVTLQLDLNERELVFCSSTVDEACQLAALGNLAAAHRTLEKELQHQPSAAGLFAIGTIQLFWMQHSGDVQMMEKCLSNLEQANQFAPELASLMHARALFHKLTTQPWPELKKHYRDNVSPEAVLNAYQGARRLRPHCPAAALELGQFQISLRLVDDGIDSYTAYSKILDAHAESHPLGKLGVRFGLGAYFAVGDLTEMLDRYSKALLLGLEKTNELILLATPCEVINPAVLDCYRDFLSLVSDGDHIQELLPLSKEICRDLSFFGTPDGDSTPFLMSESYIEQQWIDAKKAPLLKVKPSLQQRGTEALRELGLPEGAWYVTIHSRTGGFRNEASTSSMAHRWTNIEIFAKAAEKIIAKGGWIVQLGEDSSILIPCKNNYIPYCHSAFKSDWMDVFLCANARFHIGSPAGIAAVPKAAGVPVVLTNYPLTAMRCNKDDLFIPKLIFNQSEDRLLTFKEMLSPPLLDTFSALETSYPTLKFIENTETEVVEVAEEMLARVNGTISYSAQDDELQSKFRNLLPRRYGCLMTRIGARFLHKYQALLD